MGGLRVLMVADVSPLQPSGGSARVVRQQARGLAARGHQVTLLCRQPADQVARDDEMEGVRLVHYAVNRSNAPAYAWTSVVGARKSYLRRMRSTSFDVVVFHQPLSAVGVQSALAPRQPSMYCFYSPAGEEYKMRATRPETGSSPMATPAVAAAMAWIEHRAIRRAQTVVVLSEFSHRLLEQHHPGVRARSIVIPAGVDLERFCPAADRSLVRERLGLPLDVKLLLTIRDLEQRMGIDTLLEAVASLGEREKLLCIVGGSGPLRSFLEHRAGALGLKGSVRFTGHIPADELPLYYQAADLFVLPTQAHEGFGLVTVEALACAAPVVATPVGATPEILAPLSQALLSKSASAEALAEAILRGLQLAADEAFRERCRCHVEANYSWSRHVAALERELASLGGRPAEPAPASTGARAP